MPPLHIKQAIAVAAAQGLARLDAQLLLLDALGQPARARTWLLSHDTDLLTAAVQTRVFAACERRVVGEPLAYIVGHKDFFGLTLDVDARVLVPRPDTETLVEWALALLEAGTRDGRAARVADLGTGSGAIALALRHARSDVEVTAVDLSGEALAVARANARRLGLVVHFAQGNWLEGLPADFDLIVSNPPYIASGDLHLADLTHEPHQALVSGPEGLDDLRSIVSQAGAHVRPGGWLLLEHGHDQADAVCALLVLHGFVRVGSRNDLAGIQRCSGGQWLPTGENQACSFQQATPHDR